MCQYVTLWLDRMRRGEERELDWTDVPKGGLQTISRDTDNNDVMYNCWWTNKRS